MIVHMEKTFKAMQCQNGKNISRRIENNRTPKPKKAPDFLVPV